MSEYKRIQKLNRSVCFQEQLEEQIIQNPREVIFHTVASMCDNKHLFKFKKDANGEFKLSCNGFAYSNFGIKNDKYELTNLIAKSRAKWLLSKKDEYFLE